MSKALLITGATGKQGGAVIRALVAAGTDFKLLAVTRDTISGSAQSLVAKSPQISLVQGNLDDTETIFHNAEKIHSQPIWGVFSVQLPAMNKSGPAIEEAQGKSLVDSAIKHGVKHFVYSSVDRHGERSIDNPTSIPHFVSKHNIEKHLIAKSKSTGMTWTILRPVAFMENFDGGFVGKVFATSWKLVVRSRPLQLIATEDIGVFGAKALLDADSFKDKAISLAGDELTYAQMNKVFEEKTGSEAPLTWNFLARLVLWFSEEMGTMFSFFEKEGYGADIAEIKAHHPGVKSFAAWLDARRHQ
ncbi:hypothetical protein AB5N19_13922 [Seiridium cardinale]